MPVDLEAKLAELCALWEESVTPVDVAEILGRDNVDVADLDDRHADPPRRPGRSVWLVATAAALVAALVGGLAVIVRVGDQLDPADVQPSTVPAPTPTTTEPPRAGGMWPQSTLDEVRAAQERADLDDPDYTWQLAPQLTPYAEMTTEEPGQVELVERFLREVLGWEASLFDPQQSEGASLAGGALRDLRYLRCAPGRTNPLYPPGREPEMGELCAPTIDDLRYEVVSVDLAQLDREGPEGIWVVNRWRRLRAPFAQANPVAAEAEATERLEEFLAARIAGTGAEGHVQVIDPDEGALLLYTTTAGARYERYEIERVDGPHWPDGRMTFAVRLFADGDATVVEQEIHVNTAGLWLDATTTTENGQPVTVSYTSEDGEVTVSAPSTWQTFWPGVGPQADVWFGFLWQGPEHYSESGENLGLVDPVAYDAWCAANGGSPLLSAPADAAAIAQQVVADPNFETTAPVAARIGGIEAVSIDVALAPGGEACGVGMIEISRWIHELGSDPGLRLRLYLVDLPEGMSVETLAVTVVAPEERFDEFLEETAPIIESIEFHPNTP
jgi:hypothetical protein